MTTRYSLPTESELSLQSEFAVEHLVSGHYKPASNGRNDPATKICVSWHFSSKQARTKLVDVGLVRKKNASLFMRSYAGSTGWVISTFAGWFDFDP
jgi:hypothetical protein